MPRVLVVEDNALNLELVSVLLDVEGCEVLAADTAAEGIRMAVAEQPDLIIMDVRLPDMGGYDAVRNLKADPRTARIPVMAFTAHAMRGEDARASAAGCDAYLTKPVDTKRFHEVVRRLLHSGPAKQAEPAPPAATPTDSELDETQRGHKP
jgi:CheY-like chemotaxis protein